MRVPEAAAYFKIPRNRMYELVQRGLPAARIGVKGIRVNPREVEQYLRENSPAGPR
jgi:excisionase family DNA binding protein